MSCNEVSPTPTTPESPPLSPLTTPSLSPANDDHSDTRKSEKSGAKSAPVHCWAHTTDTAKVTASNRVLATTGKGYAFTLNLSPTEIAAANDNRKGFADYFKRRISRALKRALGYVPDYLITVGVAARDRLHLHGTIEANDNEADAVKRALKPAGGIWEHGRGSKYQCQMERLYTPDVWSAYCLRDSPKARRLIKGKAVSITTPLRHRAREHWSTGRPDRGYE